MEKVILKALQHRNMECIGIYSKPSAALNRYYQQKAGAKWSATHRCWYMPCTEANYLLFCEALTGKANIDAEELKKYLHRRKKEKPTVGKDVLSTPVQAIHLPGALRSVPQQKPAIKISAENDEALRQFKQQLSLKSYSASTIKTYSNEFMQFLQTVGKVPADEFSTARIKDYLQYCFEKLQLSENTLHSRINALKFYYESVLKREKFFWDIPRPKKPSQLPRFFNQDEIAAIIKAASNLKHKVMLMLAYSGGLRVSEVVTIKTCNIDSNRMSIFIENAKGKKDRVVTLSPVLLIMLREYWKAYNPQKKGYLFEGQFEGEAYSTRSLQKVLNAAKQKAGIIKPGSVHALRHSFATHLLDKGTDVTMIMKLLGHNDLKTTLRYLHVTNRDMIQIISPLDNLKLD